MADQGKASVDANVAAESDKKDDGAENNTEKLNSNGKDATVDTELEELLDSALEDFDKHPSYQKSKGPLTSGGGDETNVGSDKGPEGVGQSDDVTNDLFTEEFSEEMAKQFERTMQTFMSQDPAMMQQFEHLSQAAEKAGDSTEAQQEFASSLAQTLSSMAQNTEGLPEQISEEDVMGAFSSMGLGGGEGGEGAEFMPMMHGMMKSLLSKEVLYPSLKEISGKYPDWLETNKESVEKSAYDNYERQYRLMETLCSTFEEENTSDNDDMKRERFEKVIELMQQMQELGQPPKEIVGEMAPGLEFDQSGLPQFPGGTDQCSVM